MASPADKRLLELLDKWLTSLELHSRYAALDEDRYWQVQPWIEHQRPTRWIIDLAKQKTLALKAEVEERIGSGDARFSDSLELMIFLANLVGSEHIERFIPIAEPRSEAPPPSAPDAGVSGTREMPKFVVERQPASMPAADEQVARVERKGASAKANARSAGKPASKGSARSQAAVGDSPAAGVPVAARAAMDAGAAHAGAAHAGAADPGAGRAAPTETGSAHASREQVIADAVRLVQWGRKWFELPELVARMAGRPPLAEVRRILKENKPAIEEKARN